MSATNPLAASEQAPAGHEKRAYEPSMEDILASIRRIIADDQSLPKRSSSGEPAAMEALIDTLQQPMQSPPTPPSTEPTPFPTPRAALGTPLSADSEAIAPDSSSISEAAESEEADPVGSGAHVSSFPSHQPIRPELASDTAAAQASAVPRAYETLSAPQFPTPHGPAGDEPATEPSPFRILSVPEPAPREAPASLETAPDAEATYASERPTHLRGPAIEENETLYDTPIEPPRPYSAKPAATLFSAETDSSVSSAFNMLAASRLASNSDELMTLAREMIRPLLRTWLDDNLPSMVERMVRAEIERVARGGGR